MLPLRINSSRFRFRQSIKSVFHSYYIFWNPSADFFVKIIHLLQISSVVYWFIINLGFVLCYGTTFHKRALLQLIRPTHLLNLLAVFTFCVDEVLLLVGLNEPKRLTSINRTITIQWPLHNLIGVPYLSNCMKMHLFLIYASLVAIDTRQLLQINRLIFYFKNGYWSLLFEFFQQ